MDIIKFYIANMTGLVHNFCSTQNWMYNTITCVDKREEREEGKKQLNLN